MLVGVLEQREIYLTFVRDIVNFFWENCVKFKYWNINKMYGLRIRRYLNWWIIFIHISRIFNVFCRPVIGQFFLNLNILPISWGKKNYGFLCIKNCFYRWQNSKFRIYMHSIFRLIKSHKLSALCPDKAAAPIIKGKVNFSILFKWNDCPNLYTILQSLSTI